MDTLVHYSEIVNGALPTQMHGNLKILNQFGIATLAGSGPGVAVTTAVAVPPDAALPATGNYVVNIEVSQDCRAFVTGKTSAGYSVTLMPGLAANTLAAGSFNAEIAW